MGELIIGTPVDGALVLAPAGAPTVLDAAPGAGVLVLEVSGGHLSWDLFADDHTPAAVIDDPDAAQDWLWAIYGEAVAVAVADRVPGSFRSAPARPDLLTRAWRLAYAHWAARWWPASTIDGIAALDPGLLASEIATLTEYCDSLVDGADAETIATEQHVTFVARQEDYALAAGGDVDRDGLTVARGVGGWDWHTVPPGLVDASEQAVSWELVRDAGATVLRVRAAAAPGLTGPIPEHLRPHAVTDSAAAGFVLRLVGDSWVGTNPAPAESVTDVTVRVPGVGAAAVDDAPIRARVRALATTRLDSAASGDPDDSTALLLAEIAAAATDTDF